MKDRKDPLELRLRRVQAQARAGSLNAVPAAQLAARARAQGALRPEEYYTQQLLDHGPHRTTEARATVNSRLRSKEEFPRG